MNKPARKPPQPAPDRPADDSAAGAALPAGALQPAQTPQERPDAPGAAQAPETADSADSARDAPAPQSPDMRKKIGRLTRQLHDALNELGYADKLRNSMVELPDAQSRLAYIARLTGEAAEKVLGRVEQAKAQHGFIASETRRVVSSLVKDPVAAVARGEIMNFLTDVERVTQEADAHLTEIMMAQDFHDLTGQVIARVVSLAATIEAQLVQMLLETAPAAAAQPGSARAQNPEGARSMQGPVVEPDKRGADVVTDQSQVDDLLASLGF